MQAIKLGLVTEAERPSFHPTWKTCKQPNKDNDPPLPQIPHLPLSNRLNNTSGPGRGAFTDNPTSPYFPSRLHGGKKTKKRQ